MKKSPILVSACCLLMGGYAAAFTSADASVNDSASVSGINLDRPIAAPSRPSPARPAPSRPTPEPSRPAPYHPAPAPRPAPFHPSPAPRPIPRPAPGPHPGPIAPRPSPGPHPSPGIPHHGVPGPGFHNGGDRPGYTNGFRYDYNRRPDWFRAGIDFPIFAWFVTSGWQCTAFDANQEAFAASGVSQDQAAYNALYDCGGDQGTSECYIPNGYCQLR